MHPKHAWSVAALTIAAGLWSSSAAAQCTVNLSAGGLRQFEPNPPGVSRPSTLNWILVNGFYLERPSGVSPRLLVTESFGYQIVDLSDPMNPQAIKYEDYRYSATTPVPCTGDCHSSIAAFGASDDGARTGFALNSQQTSGYRSLVGSSGGGAADVTLSGDMPPLAGGGIVVQRLGSRYLAYTMDNTSLYVSDVTSLPGSLSRNNLPFETTGAPGGTSPVLAGSYLVFLATSQTLGITTGDINVVNVSTPGAVGRISPGLVSFTIGVGAWGRLAGERPYAVHAAVDPSDPTVTWILAEFGDAAFHNAGYSVGKVQNSTFSLVPGATFRPAFPGTESWQPGLSPTLAVTGGNLYALMWAKRVSPSALHRLYSVAVTGFGSVTPIAYDVDPVAYASFQAGHTNAALAGANGALYLYVASQNSGWVLPLSCVSPSSPPAADLVVQPVPCPGGAGSCPLKANDTVFVGTQLQINPLVASARPLTDWRFDFDFHAAEDNGTAPRVTNADLAFPASLPGAVTLVGPCDPRSGGAPSTGAGCWASEAANGDFAPGAAAGTSKVLTLALEGANVNGWSNTKTLPLTWKVPSVRLQNPNVLLGQTLANGSDGTPLTTGLKWYFGTSPTSLVPVACTGATCTPAPPFDAKGTYYYWITVPYPGGYTSPDCGTPCVQSLGSFTISDVSLAFTGIPAAAVAGAALNVTDASSAAAGASACGNGLEVAFCDASPGSCTASNWQPLALTPGAHAATNVPAPSTAGTYWMRIRYSYTTTGSCASPLTATWAPGVSGVSDPTAWKVVVTPLPPTIQVLVNGVDPCIGAGGACAGGVPANLGDTIMVKAWLGFSPDLNPPPTTAWSFGAASPATCGGTLCQGVTFTYTGAGPQTISLSGYPGIADPAATKLMSVSVPPVTASNSTLPAGACAGSPVTLTASPSVAGATYAWTGPNGFTSTQQNPTIASATTAASGSYSVTRTIAGQPASTASTAAVVLAPPVVPTAGSNAPVCAGQTLALTAATVAGATYAWAGPNGFTSSQQNPSIPGATVAASGTYVVTATVSGCSTAASTVAVVNALPPAPVAGNSGPACVGGTLALAASTIPGATYAWTGPNGFTSSQQNPTVAGATSAASGVYSVTASVNGCPGPPGTTTAAVNGSPAAITAPSRLCLPAPGGATASVANAGAGASYAWTVANGTLVSGQGTSSIAFGVSAAGTTTVSVTVTAGGCATSASVDIPVAAQCGGLTTLAPCRLLDTRNPNGALGGPSLAPSTGRRFYALGTCGLPSGMAAVSANVTVLSADGTGAIVVYPGDLASPPNVSTVSIRPGRPRANNAIVKLAPDGSFWVWNAATGTVDVIVDVNGTFQ